MIDPAEILEMVSKIVEALEAVPTEADRSVLNNAIDEACEDLGDVCTLLEREVA